MATDTLTERQDEALAELWQVARDAFASNDAVTRAMQLQAASDALVGILAAQVDLFLTELATGERCSRCAQREEVWPLLGRLFCKDCYIEMESE